MKDISNRKNGEYWKENGIWYAITPTGGYANLEKHDVVEHKDNTITVNPSILVNGENTYHGYLVNGEWKVC